MNQPQALRQYLALFRTEFLLVGLLSLVTNLMMLAPTLYMLQLYDRVMQSRNELTLLAVTLITCFFLLTMAFAEWLRSVTAIRAGVRFDRLLNDRIFRLGFSAALATERGKAAEALQDLTQMRQFLTSSGLFAFFDVPWTFIYITVLFILHPMLGTVAIIFCTIQFGIAMWNQRSSDHPLQDAGAAALASQQFLDSKARNIETLHVMGMLPGLYRRWQTMHQRWSLLDGEAQRVQRQNQFVNKFVRYSMQSLMLGAGAVLAVQGAISVGSMIASNVLIARALQPFDVIVNTWKQFIQARQSAARLNQLLMSEPIVAPAIEAGTLQGRIVLQQLGVRLGDSDKYVLQNLDLDIRPGQILTVMGPSGSGKTTLARCLVGVCPWQDGELLVDGHAADRLPPQHFAASIGYLPQDVALIEGTIAENIARFAEPDTHQVIEAANAAGIHDSILRLPHGYDTRIEDASGVLSGGQRQLVGLARAMYGEPAILVLDEPNSHLDEHGEASLLHALQMLRSRGKTIVLVSHRAGILKITDRLLILKHGEIDHYGPRDAVLSALNQAKSAAIKAA